MGSRALVLVLGRVLAACTTPTQPADEHEHEHTAEAPSELTMTSCAASTADGYKSGSKFSIVVVTVDGKPVERDTAQAYYFMAKAAAADGVQLAIVSGFRTMSQQQYLYSCYVNCSCNNCNLAAKPGYSNHQSGSALDLNTSAPGVYAWLSKNAGKFGFKRTVPSEAWHWEYLGSRPVGGPCGKLDADPGAAWTNAKKDPQGKADYRVCTGEKFKLWVRYKNTGSARWTNLGDKAKFNGESVFMVAQDGKDPLTGLQKISVKENQNGEVLPSNWGGGAGKDCEDKEGCRRTVFSDNGLEATAPGKPGTYTSEWHLEDGNGKSAKAFGQKAKLTVAVEDCAPSGDGNGDVKPPPDNGGSSSGSTDENLPTFPEDPPESAEGAHAEGDAIESQASCAVQSGGGSRRGSLGLGALILLSFACRLAFRSKPRQAKRRNVSPC